MLTHLFQVFSYLEHIFWSYIAFTLILVLGVYMTVRMNFLQIRLFPKSVKLFFNFLTKASADEKGIHPLKAFASSVGGMIGIGNIVGIVSALQFGGPGALFWVWIAGLFGSIIKYSEILLGLKYRVHNDRGGYDGGPLYYLKIAFKSRIIPVIVALLLCIYGVEIYQFHVITDSLSSNWHINRFVMIALLLSLILYTGIGGIQRLGKICSLLMPFFILSYVFIALYVIGKEYALLPAIFKTVCTSAFTGHAAVGGFVGSSLILTLQQGISRAIYSGDIGIGYDSIIQSESSTTYPHWQALLGIFGVFIDNFICTLSILLVLVTGTWLLSPQAPTSDLVLLSLDKYFPSMHIFLPLFLLLAGFTTIIAYFCVGLKCARYLSPKYGERLYFLYAFSSFLFFSFFDQTKALLVMSLSGSLLLIFNLLGIYRLRKEILSFEKDYELALSF